MRALLARTEVDEALELGAEELVVDADDLLDAGDADPREGDVEARQGGLNIGLRDDVHEAERSDGSTKTLRRAKGLADKCPMVVL
jgi:hypothetical protein